MGWGRGGEWVRFRWRRSQPLRFLRVRAPYVDKRAEAHTERDLVGDRVGRVAHAKLDDELDDDPHKDGAEAEVADLRQHLHPRTSNPHVIKSVRRARRDPRAQIPAPARSRASLSSGPPSLTSSLTPYSPPSLAPFSPPSPPPSLAPPAHPIDVRPADGPTSRPGR